MGSQCAFILSSTWSTRSSMTLSSEQSAVFWQTRQVECPFPSSTAHCVPPQNDASSPGSVLVVILESVKLSEKLFIYTWTFSFVWPRKVYIFPTSIITLWHDNTAKFRGWIKLSQDSRQEWYHCFCRRLTGINKKGMGKKLGGKKLGGKKLGGKTRWKKLGGKKFGGAKFHRKTGIGMKKPNFPAEDQLEWRWVKNVIGIELCHHTAASVGGKKERRPRLSIEEFLKRWKLITDMSSKERREGHEGGSAALTSPLTITTRYGDYWYGVPVRSEWCPVSRRSAWLSGQCPRGRLTVHRPSRAHHLPPYRQWRCRRGNCAVWSVSVRSASIPPEKNHQFKKKKSKFPSFSFHWTISNPLLKTLTKNNFFRRSFSAKTYPQATN